MSAAEKDFLISSTRRDSRWAEWIAWCLEQAGYSVIIQAWGFPLGSNFVYEMDHALKQAQRVIVVLSPAYLASEYAFSQWVMAFRGDPQGQGRRLLPVRVEPCRVEGLLGSIVYCDLGECDEETASARLLVAAQGQHPHPSSRPFPGRSRAQASHPRFPGPLPPIENIPYPHNPVFTEREDLPLGQKLLKTLQRLVPYMFDPVPSPPDEADEDEVDEDEVDEDEVDEGEVDEDESGEGELDEGETEEDEVDEDEADEDEVDEGEVDEDEVDEDEVDEGETEEDEVEEDEAEEDEAEEDEFDENEADEVDEGEADEGETEEDEFDEDDAFESEEGEADGDDAD